MGFYTVFSKSGCDWCEMAVEDLYAMGERPIIHMVDKDHALRTLLLMAGLKTVPQVFSPEGYHIGGYSDLVDYLVDKDEDDSDDPY
jgi:glutaredoxin